MQSYLLQWKFVTQVFIDSIQYILFFFELLTNIRSNGLIKLKECLILAVKLHFSITEEILQTVACTKVHLKAWLLQNWKYNNGPDQFYDFHLK